jgi:hypothetical protein
MSRVPHEGDRVCMVSFPKRGTCAFQDSFRTSLEISLDLGHVDGNNAWAEPCDY